MKMQFRRTFWIANISLLLSFGYLFFNPDKLFSQSSKSRFAYTLASTYYYPVPKVIRKPAPQGSLLPFTDNKLGWIPVATELRILEQKGDWIQVRDEANKSIHGWVMKNKKLSLSDPLLYFELKAGTRVLQGHSIFNMYSDNSGGSVNKVEFDDDIFGELELDLSNCQRLEFSGKQVKIILKKSDGTVEEYSGKLRSGDCYLVASIKIKLNQTGKTFILQRKNKANMNHR